MTRLKNLRVAEYSIIHISPTALSALFYGYRIIYECRFVMKQFPRNPSNIVTVYREIVEIDCMRHREISSQQICRKCGYVQWDWRKHCNHQWSWLVEDRDIQMFYWRVSYDWWNIVLTCHVVHNKMLRW